MSRHVVKVKGRGTVRVVPTQERAEEVAEEYREQGQTATTARATKSNTQR